MFLDISHAEERSGHLGMMMSEEVVRRDRNDSSEYMWPDALFVPGSTQGSVAVHPDHPEAQATHLHGIPARKVFLKIVPPAFLFQISVRRKEENTLSRDAIHGTDQLEPVFL
jgi:hypothetical protein